MRPTEQATKLGSLLSGQPLLFNSHFISPSFFTHSRTCSFLYYAGFCAAMKFIFPCFICITRAVFRNRDVKADIVLYEEFHHFISETAEDKPTKDSDAKEADKKETKDKKDSKDKDKKKKPKEPKIETIKESLEFSSKNLFTRDLSEKQVCLCCCLSICMIPFIVSFPHCSRLRSQRRSCGY